MANEVELAEFLRECVEGWLFGDLENMSRLEADERGYGAAGYPMVSTTLAGMELLGGLICTRPPHRGTRHFELYWADILVPTSPRYGLHPGLSGLVRSLVRDGLAHQFLAKPGILITKPAPGTPSSHLSADAAYGLCLDCIELFKDFRSSYHVRIAPILAGRPLQIEGQLVTAQHMQGRLNKILGYNAQESRKQFRAVVPGWQPASGPVVVSTVGSAAPTMFSPWPNGASNWFDDPKP